MFSFRTICEQRSIMWCSIFQHVRHDKREDCTCGCVDLHGIVLERALRSCPFQILYLPEVHVHVPLHAYIRFLQGDSGVSSAASLKKMYLLVLSTRPLNVVFRLVDRLRLAGCATNNLYSVSFCQTLSSSNFFSSFFSTGFPPI